MSNCDLCGETASYHLCDEHAAEGERSLIDLRQQLAAAESQRDELLAILERVSVHFEDALTCDDGWAKTEDWQLLEEAQAAIASARSPSPVRLGQGGSGQTGEATD